MRDIQVDSDCEAEGLGLLYILAENTAETCCVLVLCASLLQVYQHRNECA